MECFQPSAAAISMLSLSSLAALFASGAFLAPKPVYLLGPAWATVSTVASCLMRQKAPMSLAQGANDIESKSTQIDIVILIDKIDRLCHLPHVTKTPAKSREQREVIVGQREKVHHGIMAGSGGVFSGDTTRPWQSGRMEATLPVTFPESASLPLRTCAVHRITVVPASTLEESSVVR